MAEFTGERVIPGQVDIDLLNEHLARYTFAGRLARGKRVLDAGCGAGYGSAELAATAHWTVGLDFAEEAVAFAREHYRLPNLAFERASCTALPHRDASFDLVVSFEVIEHLEDWRGFLREARRVLAPNGQFIVSTPNKLYYTESRGADGANPFHVHEFEFEEFREALREVFPHVALYLENHVGGVTFQPHEPGHTVEVRVDAGEPASGESHFFVAVCAHRPQLGNPTFVYIPRAANVLRERERHIALLENELAQKDAWLQKALADHDALMSAHAALQADLDRANAWAASLNREINEGRARIVALQAELEREQESARQTAAAYDAKIAEVERDLNAKIEWARSLDTEVHKQTAELSTAVGALHRTEKELEDRTAWALRLKAESEKLAGQLELVRASRWVRLGRRVGMGPPLPGE